MDSQKFMKKIPIYLNQVPSTAMFCLSVINPGDLSFYPKSFLQGDKGSSICPNTEGIAIVTMQKWNLFPCFVPYLSSTDFWKKKKKLPFHCKFWYFGLCGLFFFSQLEWQTRISNQQSRNSNIFIWWYLTLQ